MPETFTIDDSSFGRLLAATETKLQAIGLAEIPVDRIVLRKRPWDKDLPTPYCIVSPAPEEITDRTNDQTDVTFNLMVSLVRASNRNLIDGLGLELKWREQIITALHHYRALATLQTGHDLLDVTVEPGEPIIPEAFLDLYDAQYLMLRCWTRQTRDN
jgi:hypothetical protein